MPVALVGEGGVGVAVGDDHLAQVEVRADNLLDKLGARSLVEQRLGAGVHFGVLQAVENLAHLLADGGAARFTGGEDGEALFAQEFHQGRDVGGLAGAFGSFEGDEHYSLNILTWRRGSLP